MTDPIFDPITGVAQVTNPQTQTSETHQDIFWWSSDIFNNPDMFQAVPETAPKAQEDFHLDLGQLEANKYAPAPTVQTPVEPEIIEPQVQETFEEYQARQNPPQPEIIEQVIEPQMKPEVKVNPRNNNRNEDRVPRTATPADVQKPIPRPQVQAPAKPVVQASAPKPNVDVDLPKSSEVNRPTSVISDLQKKLAELISTARNIYALEKKQEDEVVELLWANNDKVTILYQITLPENGISIKKIEKDIETDEENINDLWFVLDTENNSLQVILDDVLLLDEVENLKEDAKKKMQVTEKLNKFIFLLSEQEKKIAKEAKEKEEAEQERRRLQDIFRNF